MSEPDWRDCCESDSGQPHDPECHARFLREALATAGFDPDATSRPVVVREYSEGVSLSDEDKIKMQEWVDSGAEVGGFFVDEAGENRMMAREAGAAIARRIDEEKGLLDPIVDRPFMADEAEALTGVPWPGSFQKSQEVFVPGTTITKAHIVRSTVDGEKVCANCRTPEAEWAMWAKGNRACSQFCEAALEARETPHKEFFPSPEFPPHTWTHWATKTPCEGPINWTELTRDGCGLFGVCSHRKNVIYVFGSPEARTLSSGPAPAPRQ